MDEGNIINRLIIISPRDFRSCGGIAKFARNSAEIRMEWSVTSVLNPTFAICVCLPKIPESSSDRTLEQ